MLKSLGIYAVVAGVIILPALFFGASSVIGEGGDPWQTMWRFESKAALLTHPSEAPPADGGEGGSLADEFFGGGEPRLVNLSVWPWLPLQLIAGQPLTYNIVWLVSFIASGYGMYVLVKYLLDSSNHESRFTVHQSPVTSHELAAIVSGLYYMLLPYHLAQARGHFGAMQLQWLPVAILLFLRFMKRPTITTTIGLAAVLTIQAWTEHHYMLWLALFFILYSVFNHRELRSLFSRHGRHIGLLAALLAVFVVVPYWPTIRLAAAETSLLNLGVDQTIRFSADLFSYITPSSFHPLWGGVVDQLFRQRFTGNPVEATQYIGLVALLLIIFFRHKIPVREYYFWATISIFFLVLSLGPRLHLLGRVLPIPLPYALVDSWPVFSSIRAVGRAGVMVGLGMSVLLGWVVATQIRRGWVSGVLVGVIILDFLFGSLPLQSVEVPPENAVIQELSGSRIVELPAATNYTVSSQALYNSRYHGKEVVGIIALERTEETAVLQEVRSLPALRHLLYLRTGQLRLDRPDFFDQALPETLAETLQWLDIGGIVVHRDSLSTLQAAAIDSFLTDDIGLVAEEFPDTVVYPTPSETRQRGDGIFLARDGRWENVGFDEERGSTFAEIPTEVGITLYNTTDVPKKVRLQFTIAPESHGTMLFASESVTEQLLGGSGDVLEVKTEVAPRARQNYVFRNQLTQKVIIQDPRLIVDP